MLKDPVSKKKFNVSIKTKDVKALVDPEAK